MNGLPGDPAGDPRDEGEGPRAVAGHSGAEEDGGRDGGAGQVEGAAWHDIFVESKFDRLLTQLSSLRLLSFHFQRSRPIQFCLPL